MRILAPEFGSKMRSGVERDAKQNMTHSPVAILLGPVSVNVYI